MGNEKPYAGGYKHTMTILALLGPASALLVIRQIVPPFCHIFSEHGILSTEFVDLAIAVGVILLNLWPIVVGWLAVEAILMEKVVKRRSTARWICAISWVIPWSVTVTLLVMFLEGFYPIFRALGL
jgi:hypothetical protein